MNEPGGAASRIHRAVALQVFNSIVALLVLNLLLALAYGVLDRARPPRPAAPRLPSAALDRAYPELTPAGRDSMLAEIWSRPLEHEPNALLREPPFRGRFVNVSAAGFRLVPEAGPWPPDPRRFNVFLFGGSTTFGYGVADDQTIAAHLQGALRHDPRFGGEACVYNFGRAFLFSTPERQLFERLLLEGHAPDVAVFIDGLNDFYFASDEPERDKLFNAGLVPPRRPGANELVIEWFARTPLGRLARDLGARSRGPAGTDPVTAAADSIPSSERIARVIRRYRGNQRLIAAAAGASGVRPLFVWQPVPTYRYDLRRHAFQEAGFERHQLSGLGYAWLDSALAAGAVAMEPRFLWCAALAEGDTLPCYVDRVHYSGRMNRRIAERVASEFTAMGLPKRK